MPLQGAAHDVSYVSMARLLMLLLAILPLGVPALAQEPKSCGAPAAINDGWALATPAEAGFDGARLCNLDGLLEQWPQRNIHAVVVARRGKLVMERYFTGSDERWGQQLGDVKYAPDMLHDLRSISKSTVSLLVGIALGDGKFPPLDSPVFDAFPAFASLATPEKRRITFRQLLTMSSGFAWDETIPYSNPANSERRLIASTDPVRYVLEQPLVTPPGTVYNYNGGNTALLAAAIAKANGTYIHDYAREKLFAPLDISQSEWVSMPASGEIAAASGLRLRPRDSAKLGQILLADGQWNGRQVIPKGWASESMKPRLNGAGIYYYGYQWWLGRSWLADREIDWIAGVGYGGQRLFIVPSLDLVVMINAGHYRDGLQSIIPHAILNQVVLPAVKD